MSIQELKPHFNEDVLASKSEEELKEVFNQVYIKDFITNPFTVNGKKIKIVAINSKIPGFKEYQETFAHIVTREYKSQMDRFFEINRANRIHWVKQILLSHPCKEIKYFKWKDERGICKQYFWFLSGKFIVILKDVSVDLQIVTAFCVDEEEKLKYFEWFKLYEEGKSECK